MQKQHDDQSRVDGERPLDGQDLPRPAAGSIEALDETNGEHTLTLEFGRFLSQAEWREVIDHVRRVPYIRGLTVTVVPSVKPEPPPAPPKEPATP